MFSDCKSCQKRGKGNKGRKNPDRQSEDIKPGREVAQRSKVRRGEGGESTLGSRLTSICPHMAPWQAFTKISVRCKLWKDVSWYSSMQIHVLKAAFICRNLCSILRFPSTMHSAVSVGDVRSLDLHLFWAKTNFTLCHSGTNAFMTEVSLGSPYSRTAGVLHC